MEEQYIRGINSEIIRTLKKIAEGIGNSSETVSKLDEVITAVNNIKISADSVNLNTDTLESLIQTTNTTLNTINNKVATASNQLNKGVLNPTHLASVSEGDTTFSQNVVLCNITDNNITVTVTGADDTNSISVVLTPGWNPIIVKSITGATANTLIYGY